MTNRFETGPLCVLSSGVYCIAANENFAPPMRAGLYFTLSGSGLIAYSALIMGVENGQPAVTFAAALACWALLTLGLRASVGARWYEHAMEAAAAVCFICAVAAFVVFACPMVDGMDQAQRLVITIVTTIGFVYGAVALVLGLALFVTFEDFAEFRLGKP